MYSPAEIEKKRLLAQQRKAQSQQSRMVDKPQTPSRPTAQVLQPNNKPRAIFPNSSGVKRKIDSPVLADLQQKQVKLNEIPPSTFFGRKERITALCRMVTDSRFEIDVPYDAELINYMKTVPSRCYDQKSRLWNFHIRDYSKVIVGIKSKFSDHVDVTGIPSFVLQTFKGKSDKKSEAEPDLSTIDQILINKLLPFQREGVIYGIQKHGRCMIADDMGLGKTIQALGIAHYYRESWPLLIVAPSSMRYQWSEAICEFLPSVPIHHIFHYTSGRSVLEKEKITIVSYDLFSRNINAFESKAFGFVIFDESHILKSHKTERTKAAQRIASTARHVVLLTGTPALSRPIELYSQISLINRYLLKIQDYGLRYCDAQRLHFGWDYQGVCNTHELQLFLKANFLIRRLKSEVLKQLPDKIRQVVMLDPDLIKQDTIEMKKMAENLIAGSLTGFERHTELLRYYAESSKLRLTAVGNYVKDLIDKKEKFIIFAHHQCVLDKISEVLDKNGVMHVRIDGKTAADTRKRNVDRFQQSSDCLVAVLSITAANSGITLTAASFVVFAELYWNPAELTQAEGRAHRIGQQECVVIQYLIAKGTVDDLLWPLLQEKAHFLQKAGLDQNFSLSQAELVHQASDEPSTSDDKAQNTLESFGFSQTVSSQEDKFFTPLQSNQKLNNSTSSNSDQKTVKCDSATCEDFAKLLEDDAEDFENIDLDNIC